MHRLRLAIKHETEELLDMRILRIVSRLLIF